MDIIEDLGRNAAAFRWLRGMHCRPDPSDLPAALVAALKAAPEPQT